MLTITVLGDEYFDEVEEKFVYPDSYELKLEHSLVALSKWEEEFEKPFLSGQEPTTEETLGYIYHMILDPTVPREVVNRLSEANFEAINEYINRKATATWFNDRGPQKRNTETITSELIYFWMDGFGIDRECANWHLTRLFTLIKIHSMKNEKPKKMNRQEQLAEQRRLNEMRRAQTGSRG